MQMLQELFKSLLLTQNHVKYQLVFQKENYSKKLLKLEEELFNCKREAAIQSEKVAIAFGLIN